MWNWFSNNSDKPEIRKSEPDYKIGTRPGDCEYCKTKDEDLPGILALAYPRPCKCKWTIHEKKNTKKIVSAHCH